MGAVKQMVIEVIEMFDEQGKSVEDISKTLKISQSEVQEILDNWSEYFEELDFDDSMDGDFDSGMASAGFGTDEDYGYFGDYE